MKSVMVGMLVCLMTIGFAAAAWGADIPSSGAGAAAATAPPPAAAPAKPAVQTPAAAPKESRIDKTITEIKAQVAVADKFMAQHDEEMAKPDDKKDLKKALTAELNAAQAYYRAALKAKGNSAFVTKADEKQTFLDTYEKPNRDKAISLMLELAATAKEKKAYPDAHNLYAEVLKMDPKNATALAGIKAVDEEARLARMNPTGKSTGGGSNQDIKSWQRDYKTDYSGTHIDWARSW
jgi:hypothetical protein